MSGQGEGDQGAAIPPADMAPPQTAAPEPGAKPAPHKPARRKRPLLRWAGRIFLLTFLLLGAFGLWGLTGRPIALPVWAVAEIEARMNAAFAPVMPEGAVSIGAVEVAVDDDWVPRIRLEDLRLLKPDGGALMALPELRLALDPAAALRGTIQPRSLRLSGARIAVRRDRDGHYDFDFGGGGSLPRVESFAQLFALVDQVLEQPAAASLRLIEAEALTFQLSDARTGRVWQVGDGRLTLENRSDQVAAQLGMSVLGSQTGTQLAVTLISDKGSDSARATARIDGLAAQDLAALAPILGPLGVLDAPISGQVATAIGAGGITAVDAELTIGAGALRPTPAAAPVPFDSARLKLHYDPATGRIVMDDLALDSPALQLTAEGHSYLQDAQGRRLSGPLGGALPETFLTQIRFREVKIDPAGLFQEPAHFSQGALDLRLRLDPFRVEVGQLSLAEEDRRVTAKGQVSADAAGWRVALDLTMNQIAHDRLVALWPVTLAPRTREWIVKNILSGELFDVTAALRMAPEEEARLHLGFSFQQAEVRFLPSLPPISQGYGYSTIDGKTYTLVLSRGRIMPPQGGVIDVSGSVFKVPDIRARPASAEITLATRSSLTAALSLLDLPPFTFLTKAGRPVDLGEGQAQVEARIALPLKNKVPANEISYQVAGTVTDFRSDKLAAGRVITADQLQVRADPAGLVVAGPGQIDGVPFDVTFSQGFTPDTRESARIEGTVELSPATAEAFGLGLPRGMVSGQGAAQIVLDLPKGQPGRLRVTSDLNRIGLALPELGWSKPAAGTGRLLAEVVLDQTPRVERLEVQANGLTAEGQVTMRPEGGLDRAQFSSVRLGNWLNGPVEITGRGAGRPVGIAMTGGMVDLRGMPPTSARGTSGSGGGPLQLSLDRLVVASSVALTGFRGSFTQGSGLSGDFTARMNGGAAVSGNVAPSPRGTAVRLLSDDAGAVMRDAGIYASAYGGSLSVLLVPRAAEGVYDGQATIRNTRVRNNNVLAELLNAISVVGLLEQLGGSGIAFAEVEGQFLLTPSAVQITRGSAIGASLGVSMAGVYQTGSAKLDMKGVVSPIYLVNGVGALVSRRGEGLFGFNYNLRGTAQAPEVSVNPFSILTPGMFRELFRAPPPVLGESQK